jgi:hypothetical protein
MFHNDRTKYSPVQQSLTEADQSRPMTRSLCDLSIRRLRKRTKRLEKLIQKLEIRIVELESIADRDNLDGLRIVVFEVPLLRSPLKIDLGRKSADFTRFKKSMFDSMIANFRRGRSR